MSDTTNDTSAIDEKNQSTSSTSNSLSSQIIKFVTSVIAVVLIILFYFTSSGLILYLCKLAQSNILPTDLDCAPYTDTKPNIQPIKTNIFTTFTDPETSMKLEFPYDSKNSKNKIIEIFKEYKDKSSSNFLANYFISITESLLQFNYSTMTTIMNLINETIPESLIIGIGPMVSAFLYAFGLIINQFYFIYLWFSNMYWFFKHNSNDTGSGLPKWEDVTLFTPVDWWLGAGLVFLFILLLIFGLPILAFIPVFAYHNSIISSLFYKGVMNNKSASAFTVVTGVLKYYKITIVTIISLLIILLAFSNLGTIPGLFSILTVAAIYWGVITLDIYKPISESNLSESVSYKQATKTCPSKVTTKKHGLLYDLVFGQSGGRLSKEIKKAGKNLSSI
jgi:hypothetical protein